MRLSNPIQGKPQESVFKIVSRSLITLILLGSASQSASAKNYQYHGLIELDYGSYEGLRQAEVPSNVWRDWRNDNDFAAPQGESLNQVQRRVAEACDDLVQRLNGRTAVVVSHVSPIKSAVAWALGMDASVGWKTQLSTASITRISVSSNGVALTAFNEVAR